MAASRFSASSFRPRSLRRLLAPHAIAGAVAWGGASEGGTAPAGTSLPVWEHWADLTSVAVLLLALVLVVLFYRRLVGNLRRSERRLRELFEAAPFAVIVTRRVTGTFLFANRHAIELLGLSPTDYSRQTIRYTRPAEARTRLLAQLAAFGRVEQLEGEVESYTGRRFPSIASAVLIQFDSVEAILGSFQDISRLKEAELKLRASETRLSAVFQAAPDGIAILDRDGIVQNASASCVSLLDVPDLSHVQGRHVLDFLAPADRPLAAQLLAEADSHHGKEVPAFRLARRDGSHTWIEPRGVPITDPVSGQPALVLVLRNITQRRDAQEALAAHAAQLQDALNRIAHLQNEIVRVCAWTKQVQVDGRWIPIDHYLAQHLGLKVSHGISEEGLAMLGAPPEDPPPAASPEEPQPPA